MFYSPESVPIREQVARKQKGINQSQLELDNDRDELQSVQQLNLETSFLGSRYFHEYLVAIDRLFKKIALYSTNATEQ